MKSEEAEIIWYSLKWFSAETIRSFYWSNKYFLYFVPAIPFLFFLRWLFQIRFRPRLELAFPPKQFLSFRSSMLRFIPDLLLGISVAFILLSLARPQTVEISKDSYAEGIDIVLVLDVSESMEIMDFKPNRLKSSIEVAKAFISNRPYDKIGLVVFSSNALSVSPLTFDKTALKDWLEQLSTDMMESSGTAIGNAIATGINRLRESDAKSKAIILISDGENTAGKIDPESAAKLASGFGVKIYSIAIGKEGKVPFYDKQTRETVMLESHLDESTLRRVAEISNGKYFKAENKKQLETIFSEIDKLEKYKFTTASYSETKDYYQIYLRYGIIFFLLWLFTKNTFLSNALED